MNELIVAANNQQAAETLLAIRKGKEWEAVADSFEDYCSLRWSLSKTRCRLLCDFAKLIGMCRKEGLKLPDSAENVKPVLALQQHKWLETWRLCVQHGADNAQSIQALFDHFGVIGKKRTPEYILHGKQVRKAAATLAKFDGEKLVDQIGPDGLGKHWTDAVRTCIDADQARMNERGKPF